MTSADFESDIIQLKKHPKFVGIRKILDLSEENWIERDDVIASTKILAQNNLTYDLLVCFTTKPQGKHLFFTHSYAKLILFCCCFITLWRPFVRKSEISTQPPKMCSFAAYHDNIKVCLIKTTFPDPSQRLAKRS